jgi:hypothetical protein
MSKAAAGPRTFPPTTILSITTHGEIRLNSEITHIADIVYDRDGIATVLPTFIVNQSIKEFYKFSKFSFYLFFRLCILIIIPIVRIAFIIRNYIHG